MDQTAQPNNARNIHVLLDQYSESHRNPTNELFHFVCVPLIVFSLLGILWSLHPVVALAAVLGSMWYYFQLSKPFAYGMLAMSAVMLGILAMMPPMTVLPLSIAVFVVAWIGQFIGHKIEGKKPSFLEDLRFLLIGPLFVLGFLYRRLNVAY
ncbi:Mpo1 family 2-hydroxy fatty acid dioxygenase [Massilia sp. SYSU DXS3249]